MCGGGYNLNYGTDFEKFYNDRFFCRNKLIELHNFIKKTFFANSKQLIKNNTVMRGKEGWLFYLGDKSEFNFLNYNYFSQKELEHGLKYLRDIKNWCNANGKIFVVMICPDKNKIYGEYYPSDYKKINPDTESRAFQFVNYIRANYDIDIIYPYNELLAKKEKGKLLYYKEGTHWTFLGSYIGYQCLMRELKKKFDDIEEIEASGVAMDYDPPEDDYFIMFPEMKFENDKKTLYYKPVIDSKYDDRIDIRMEDKSFIAFCKEKKYSAIFFRDSFAKWLSPYTSNTFYKTTYYWRYDITTEDLAYIKENADIIVIECLERFLPNLLKQTFPQNDIAE